MRWLPDVAHSIRFRLTAWYGLLMILFMVLAGFGAWTAMGTWLRNDLDSQLSQAATQYSNVDYLRALANQPADQHTPRTDPSPLEKPDTSDYRSLIVQLGNSQVSIWSPPFACILPYSIDNSAQGARTYSTQGACGGTFRVLAVTQGFDPYNVIVAQSTEPITDALNALRWLMLALGGIGVVLAVLGGWLIAGRSLRPISAVTETASDIAESPQTAQSLAARLQPPAGHDEVAGLTATFNRMLDRIEDEFGRRQRFVSDASHELRTPLTAIRGNLDVLAMQLRRGGDGSGDEPESQRQQAIDEGFDDMSREANRMARLLDDLLFLARADSDREAPGERSEPVRLDELARQIARTASGMANGQVLAVEADAPVTVNGDPDRLSQLLWILVDNALRHTPAGRQITVTVQPVPETAWGRLVVADEGSGIEASDLPLIFDRFYRADAARSRGSGGSGLGLAIARTIVDGYGGEITAESEAGAGSRFTVLLPAAESATPTIGRPVLARAPAAFTGTTGPDDSDHAARHQMTAFIVRPSRRGGGRASLIEGCWRSRPRAELQRVTVKQRGQFGRPAERGAMPGVEPVRRDSQPVGDDPSHECRREESILRAEDEAGRDVRPSVEWPGGSHRCARLPAAMLISFRGQIRRHVVVELLGFWDRSVVPILAGVTRQCGEAGVCPPVVR